MADYVRGKNTYSEWDADADNVDLEYLDESIKTTSRHIWRSGTKGLIIKVFLLLLLFCFGLVLGYLIKNGVVVGKHENPHLAGNFSYDSMEVSLIQQFIQPLSIKEFLRSLSEMPRVAGTLIGTESALIIQNHWKSLGLNDVRIEIYNVLLSYPSQSLPSTVQAIDNKTGNVLFNTSNADHALEIKPFFAYSPSGKAKGHLVFANYGRQEDFQTLQKLNVTIKGAVVLIKLGLGHHGDKVRWATDCGAVGVLMYPDPADYAKRPVFPDGIGLPDDGIVYGSLKTFPGDPLTPHFPATDSAYRLPIQSNIGLPTIPAQPISYREAQQLLKIIEGQESPESWRGDLNVTYRLGPVSIDLNMSQVIMNVNNELHRNNIYNVIGVLHGSLDTDGYVIIGSHHDTWTSGASDPNSGMAVLMELVKAFSKLAQTGWKPIRSIVFASWDAEEYGMIGSTEWVEAHFKELEDNAIAYINIDSAVSGNGILHGLGSPLLRKAFLAAAKYLNLENENNTVFDQHSSDGIVDTGSDFASFMFGHGIPSIHVQYTDSDSESHYPLSHTKYDTYDAISNHMEHSFWASTYLTRLLATMVLSLVDSANLPLNCDDYVTVMEQAVADLKRSYSDYLAQHGIHLDILSRAITYFGKAAKFHMAHILKTNGNSYEIIEEYNRQIMQVERAFVTPRGVRDSPTFKHAIFGPHPHDLNNIVVFPGILDSILKLQNRWVPFISNESPNSEDVEAIKYQIAQVVHLIRAAGKALTNSVITNFTSKAFL